MLSMRKRRHEFRNARPEINRKAKNGTELDDDGVHLPVPVGKADVKQSFSNAQVCSRADGQKFRQALDNSQYHRQQIVVQVASRGVEKLGSPLFSVQLITSLLSS